MRDTCVAPSKFKIIAHIIIQPIAQLHIILEVKLFASHQLLVTSLQLLVTSHQLLVTSHQLLVISHQLLVTSHQFLVIRYQSLVASHRPVGNQLLVRSHQLLVFDLKNLNSQRNYYISKNIKIIFWHKKINLQYKACLSNVFFLKFYETKLFLKGDIIFRSSRLDVVYQKHILKSTCAGVSF